MIAVQINFSILYKFMLQNKSRVVHQSCCHQHKQKLFAEEKKLHALLQMAST
jgi:hypothetical protein